MMKKRIKQQTVVLLIILFCIGSPSLSGSSENNSGFIDLVNQVRTAPYSYATGLGYDADFLASRGILPETQFEPYLTDYILSSRADIINNNGADENDPFFLLTAEKKGVLSFVNFMPENTACKILIERLLREELDTGYFQHILSRDYAYAGVSMESGQMENRVNAWFLTLALGSPVLKSEGQVLNLINQFRAETAGVNDYIGRKLSRTNNDWNIYPVLEQHYPPVFMDNFLQRTARDTAFHALYGISSDLSALEKSIAYGYSGISADASTVAISFSNIGNNRWIEGLFLTLLLEEFKTWPEGAVVFSPDFQDAGPGVVMHADDTYYTGVLSFYAGNREADDGTEALVSKIYGLIFMDMDEDALYAPGEEFARVPVVVYDKHFNPVASVVTDNAGHFSVVLDSGQHYYFSVESDHFSFIEEMFIHQNQFVSLKIPPRIVNQIPPSFFPLK